MALASLSVRLAESISPELRDSLRVVHRIAPDIHLVGGGVRDLLRGETPADLDFVTAGNVQQIAAEIAKAMSGSSFALDEGRGQYRVVLDTSVKSIDLSPLRTDIEANLRERDFTVNAMAVAVQADGSLGEVIDPSGGLVDLQAGRLRVVSAQSFKDDPLRLLRGVRLAVELGLELETATAESVRRYASSLTAAAAERQRDELTRILATGRAATGVRMMDELGLLAVVLPELMPAHGVDQPGQHHYWDVFDHSVETLAMLDVLLTPRATGRRADGQTGRDELAQDFRDGLASYPLASYLYEDAGGHCRHVLLKLAGLLHDVAKPETKSTDANGRTRFLGHPEQGATKAARICERLRFGNREVRFVSLLVEEHLRPTQLAARGQAPSPRALYRFFRDLGDAAPACLVLMLADGAAAAGPRLQRQRWRAHIAYVSNLLKQEQATAEAAKAPRLITGDDLMAALHIPPGPVLGRLLSEVDEAIGAGEVSTPGEALAYARELTSPPAPSPSTERGSTEAERRWPTSPNLWDRLKPVAREMRQAPTPAENALWQALRKGRVGDYHFRRQHAIDRFIVDFYCSKGRLVIEVDGPVHDGIADQDQGRQDILEELGFRVMRFSNEEVLTNTVGVVRQIETALALERATSPSPKSERGTEGERLSHE
jgi:poly(A) polymerase